MKKLRIIHNIISDVIILLGIVMIVIYFLGFRLNIVKTGSMEPAIKTGSLCVVNTNIQMSDLKVGDIISFCAGKNMNVTHRVIGITDKGCITQGDANNTIDMLTITENEYIGKVQISLPVLGYVFAFFKTKTGFVILVLSMIAFITFGYYNQEFRK